MTRERVLDAAEGLFLEKGLRGTSVQEVAKAAGHTTGAIYSSFDGKDDLFLAVFRRKTRMQESVWRKALESVTDAADAAEAMGAALSLAMPEPAWYAVVFEFLSSAARDERLSLVTPESYTEPLEILTEILQDVSRSSPLPLDRLAPIVLALMRGLAMSWFVNPEATDARLFSDAVAVLIGDVPRVQSRAEGEST